MLDGALDGEIYVGGVKYGLDSISTYTSSACDGSRAWWTNCRLIVSKAFMTNNNVLQKNTPELHYFWCHSCSPTSIDTAQAIIFTPNAGSFFGLIVMTPLSWHLANTDIDFQPLCNHNINQPYATCEIVPGIPWKYSHKKYPCCS